MKIPSNKINDIISFFYNELEKIYSKNEIELFIKYCLEDFSGIKISSNINATLTVSESELLKYNFAVKDLKKHRPIQYILGTTDFYNLKFKVNENVLIPRPETEELVDLILKENTAEKLNVLDIGTGSGCIPVSIKKNRTLWNISAIDISEQALVVAKNNAQINSVEVNFNKADILNDVTSLNDMFDIIVSNPPYIKKSEKEKMLPNVLNFEPHIALFVEEDDALLFYKAILEFAKKMLKKDGKIYFEINETLGEETKALMLSYGFKDVVLVKDLSNKNRILHGVF